MKYIIELESEKDFAEFNCEHTGNIGDCKEDKCPFFCADADPYCGGCSLGYKNIKVKVARN